MSTKVKAKAIKSKPKPISSSSSSSSSEEKAKPVTQAITTLSQILNYVTPCELEGKEEPDETHEVKLMTPEQISLSRGILTNQHHFFNATRSATLTTGGSGLLSIAVVNNLFQFVQYTNLSALFTHYRLISAKMSIHRAINIYSGTENNTIFLIAYDPSAVSGASAPNFVDALRLERHVVDYSHRPNITRLQYRTKNRPWSLTSNTSPSGTDPFGGGAGAFYIVNSGGASNSTVYFHYVLEVVFELKNQR